MSRSTASAPIPRPLIMYAMMCDMRISPEYASARERISPANPCPAAFRRHCLALPRYESTMPRHSASYFWPTISRILSYAPRTVPISGSRPDPALRPISRTTSVSERGRPSYTVSGAEKTATTLESLLISSIRWSTMGMDRPSGPIALPPNFATTRLFTAVYPANLSVY